MKKPQNRFSCEIKNNYNNDYKEGGDVLEKINVVLKNVGEDPVIKKITNTLTSMRMKVQGNIGIICFDDDLMLIYNEDIKSKKLKPNISFRNMIIMGNCFVLGNDIKNGDFISIPETKINKIIQELKGGDLFEKI